MHPYEYNEKVLGKQLDYEVNFMIIDGYSKAFLGHSHSAF